MTVELDTGVISRDIRAITDQLNRADPELQRQVLKATRLASARAAIAVKAETPKRDTTDPKNRNTGARPGRQRRNRRPPAGTLRRSVKGFALRGPEGDAIGGVKAGARRSYYARIVHEGRKRSRFGPAEPNPYVDRPVTRLLPVIHRMFEDAAVDVANGIDRP